MSISLSVFRARIIYLLYWLIWPFALVYLASRIGSALGSGGEDRDPWTKAQGPQGPEDQRQSRAGPQTPTDKGRQGTSTDVVADIGLRSTDMIKFRLDKGRQVRSIKVGTDVGPTSG